MSLQLNSKVDRLAHLSGGIVWQRQVEELVEEALHGRLILHHAGLRLAAGPNDKDPVSWFQSCNLRT